MDQPFHHDSSNSIDAITQESFDIVPANIKIYFQNLKTDNGKPYVFCTQRENLQKWIMDLSNSFNTWVPQIGKMMTDIDDSGRGGVPSIEIVYKMYGDRIVFIANESFIRPDVREYVGIPTYLSPQRIGRSFGISNLHGQVPGEMIYWISPKDEISVGSLLLILQHYCLIKGSGFVVEDKDKLTVESVIENIHKFNDEFISPVNVSVYGKVNNKRRAPVRTITDLLDEVLRRPVSSDSDGESDGESDSESESSQWPEESPLSYNAHNHFHQALAHFQRRVDTHMNIVNSPRRVVDPPGQQPIEPQISINGESRPIRIFDTRNQSARGIISPDIETYSIGNL